MPWPIPWRSSVRSISSAATQASAGSLPLRKCRMRCANLHIDINIKGTWNCCQVAIPYMLKQGDGSIVVASSVTGNIVADAGEVACAMPKAALVGLIKCLAVEYVSCCIRVNCTQLGYTRTPMVEKMAREFNPDDPESAIDSIAVGVPMGRLAKPTERVSSLPSWAVMSLAI